MAIEELLTRVSKAAAALVDYACATELISDSEGAWAYNRVLECIGCDGKAPSFAVEAATVGAREFNLEQLLSELSECAVLLGACEDLSSARDRIGMRIMGSLMPRPSEVSKHFFELYESVNPEAATDYFNKLSRDSGYVREQAIARNISWIHSSTWGELEITINLSKPEKDPVEIGKLADAAVASDYPVCALCMENEGYAGRSGTNAHPARQNLRIVPITLGGERWGLQYSPYAYFSEHCIAMSEEHRPMHIDRAAFECLADFCEFFPHYFIGSNADLPIVGGSILNHDHFQGGKHIFPMMRAEAEKSFRISLFEDVMCEIIRWPLSVIRLKSSSRDSLLSCAENILECWQNWDDEQLGIVSHTGTTAHNTITPILWLEDELFKMDLALRCNITSDEHPLGVFHPHADKWHVKKENIGLIEVMGLAILPPRILEELDAGRLSRDEIGDTFAAVLEDAGVFKWDEAGRSGLERFIAAL